MSNSPEGDQNSLNKDNKEKANQSPHTSIWFQTTPAIKNPSQSPVVRRLVAQPIRSISTFSFPVERDQISSAAPFPSLPTKQEVINEKNAVETEIQRLKAELASLKYEALSIQHPSRTLIANTSNTNGIHEYRGLVIEDNAIESVIQENLQKSLEAQKEALVDSVLSSKQKDKENFDFGVKHRLPKFRHIVDLPQYKKTIETEQELLVPIFATRFAEKDILLEKEEELAQKYKEYDAQWQDRKKLIDEYNARTGEKSEIWPPEFTFDAPVLDDNQRLKWTANDIPMILSKTEQRDRFYYDTNSFVADPEKEFSEYKNRLVWTEEERQTFVDKYRQHPKDFAKIADALPEKTIKEVIEFYYLNRYKMNLKENEGLSKRRGGKKKVVTEGTKKNY